MRIFDGKIYRDMTAEEVSVREAEAEKAEAIDKIRPLTEAEVNRMLISQQINILDVDDNTAVLMKAYYPEWAANVSYAVGYKVQHGGKLYRVVQAHTSQEGWHPTIAPSLFEEVNETHEGTLSDPIPYSGNMALETGKHYIENLVFYKCNRDTVNPVYNPLADLVGVYVEIV